MARPLFKKILFIAFVVLYVLSPLDIIPDFLIGPGWIDDLILIGLLAWFLSGRSVPLFTRFGNSRREHQRPFGKQSHDSSSGAQTREDHDSKDSYAILGIAPGATTAEIKEAYRAAVAKYHPDKVTHLGKEFQELAHRKFVAIQEAYEQLMKAR